MLSAIVNVLTMYKLYGQAALENSFRAHLGSCGPVGAKIPQSYRMLKGRETIGKT